MQIDIINIFVLIKTGTHRAVNVIVDKTLKNVVSLIMKYSASDNIAIIIIVKNIANIIFMTL